MTSQHENELLAEAVGASDPYIGTPTAASPAWKKARDQFFAKVARDAEAKADYGMPRRSQSR